MEIESTWESATRKRTTHQPAPLLPLTPSLHVRHRTRSANLASKLDSCVSARRRRVIGKTRGRGTGRVVGKDKLHGDRRQMRRGCPAVRVEEAPRSWSKQTHDVSAPARWWRANQDVAEGRYCVMTDEGPKLAAKCYSGCGVRGSALPGTVVDAIGMHSSLPFAWFSVSRLPTRIRRHVRYTIRISYFLRPLSSPLTPASRTRESRSRRLLPCQIWRWRPPWNKPRWRHL